MNNHNEGESIAPCTKTDKHCPNIERLSLQRNIQANGLKKVSWTIKIESLCNRN